MRGVSIHATREGKCYNYVACFIVIVQVVYNGNRLASLSAKLTSIFTCMSKSTFTISMTFMSQDNFVSICTEISHLVDNDAKLGYWNFY